MVILRKARVPRTRTLRTSHRSYKQPRKTHESPFSRLQNTTPMTDLSNNTGRWSMVSETADNLLVEGFTCSPGIPVIEVVNSRVSQETLNLFLNAEFHRENYRRTVFRNHNREIQSRVMEHCIVTHNMLKLNRKPCFALSQGFIPILEPILDWLMVSAYEQHETPSKFGQSQPTMSKSSSKSSLKTYISKREVATQVTPKRMARLSKPRLREFII